MYESFPNKKRGDKLSADHVNKLSAVCRRLSGNSGGYGNSFSGPFNAATNLPPFVQHIVRVQSVTEPGVYKVRVRYYEPDTDSWATSTEESTMDSRDVGGSYSVGDRVVAFFHEQSNRFIPLGTVSSTLLLIGIATEDIEVGATDGVVTLYNGSRDGDILEDVHHDWVTGGMPVPEGNEVILGYFSDEGVWRIIGADCA